MPRKAASSTLKYLFVFLAGASMPLAFAPFNWWPLALLSPAVLLYLWLQAQSPRQSFRLGWIFGLGYFGFGVYWIYHSLHVYGHAPVAVAGGLTLLMIFTLALFIGGVLLLSYRLCNGNPDSRSIWTLPVIWFALEWFKGWVLTGFPWLSIGYAHVHSPLGGFAPLIGVYGLSFLSILLSLAIALSAYRKKPAGVILLVVVPLAGFLLQQMDWTDEFDQPLKITMVQGNIPQEMKWRRSERAKIIQTYWQASLPHLDSDLVVWPEAAIPGRSEDLQRAVLDPIDARVSEQASNLLTGILVSDRANARYYNSMIMLGVGEGEYHKRHLVPFGEYYPFRQLLSFMQSYIRIPMSDMTPGPDEQPLMKVGDVRLGVSICYEDVFSRDINLDLPQANILINTSNDAWFGDSLAPHQHLQIAQMRALETGRPMVRSTNTGRSAFIDHRGEIVSATDTFTLETLTATVQGRQGSTPFLWFARLQPLLAWLVMLAALLAIWRQSRPGS